MPSRHDETTHVVFLKSYGIVSYLILGFVMAIVCAIDWLLIYRMVRRHEICVVNFYALFLSYTLPASLNTCINIMKYVTGLDSLAFRKHLFYFLN